MTGDRKILKKIIAVLTVICFIVTALTGVFYVSYSQEINRLFDIAVIIKSQYLENVTMKQLLVGAARGMVDSLDDPYSVYLNAQDFEDLQRYIQGTFGGIGIYVEVTKDKKLIVSSPIEGTPAHQAGLKRGDVIIKIDDTFTSELDYDEAVARMRGEPGTQVRVSVMREGASSLLEFALTRENIDIPTVESSIMEDGIGYLRLKVFASNSDLAVGQHLKKLSGAGVKALILDLRENPGGDLDAAVNIAEYFVPEGPVVYIVNRYGDTKVYASARGSDLNIPLVVLINGGSASASEVLSGAIKDTGAGILIGEKTFGKGIVQGLFPFGRGEGIKLTTSKYLTPNKIDIHEKGIEPDIAVSITENDTEDIQLKKAVEYLKKQLGKGGS